MKRPAIAISLESLELPIRRGVEEAASLGASGVQLQAVGELAPQQLSQTGRRAFLQLLRSHNLELAALSCPLRHGLEEAHNQQARIELICRVLSLSFDLGARKVVVQAGPVPANPDSPEARRYREALIAIGNHGDKTGSRLALETGWETGQALNSYLATLNSGGLAAALDPANLLMRGLDPVAAIRDLNERVIHVHARDARKSIPARSAQETALGHGDLDWMELLGALEEIGYRGWLSVIREQGDRKRSDVAEGVKFLKRLLIVG